MPSTIIIKKQIVFTNSSGFVIFFAYGFDNTISIGVYFNTKLIQAYNEYN